MKISRRVKASRANGAKSRGPRTPEGKLRSQTHAIRHGLLAKCVVLEGEDPAIFLTLMAEIEARFAPVDEVELGMVEEMAAAYWRMRRGWTIEAELLNQGLRAQTSGAFATRLTASFTDADRLPKLALLQRYESRLHRMYQRAIDNLTALRAVRSAAQTAEEPNPISEQPAEPQALPSEPLKQSSPLALEFRPQPFAAPEPRPTAPPAPKPHHRPGNQEEKPAA